MGKDLSEFDTVVGTGGALANNTRAKSVLRTVETEATKDLVLLPEDPEYFIDTEYLLFVCGLMAKNLPDAAVKILRNHLL